VAQILLRLERTAKAPCARSEADGSCSMPWANIEVDIFPVLLMKQLTGVSALAFAADTWLHFATKTINFALVAPATSATNGSFALEPRCANPVESDGKPTYNADIKSCAISAGGSAFSLWRGPSTMLILNNMSTTARINTFEPTAGESYAYLGNPPNTMQGLDYVATTYAVRTQCRFATQECMYKGRIGKGDYIKCPYAFEGTLYEDIQFAYFTNSTAANNDTSKGVSNPFYFAFQANLNPVVLVDTYSENFVWKHKSGTLFTLFCNASVYDFSYTSINNTITRYSLKLSNSSVTNLVQSTQEVSKIGTPQLLQAANVALVSTNGTGFEAQVANSFITLTLGAAAGVMFPVAPSEVQARRNILVARVPIAPLICQLVANSAIVVLGVVLMGFAFTVESNETNDVQGQLSVEGIAGQRFHMGSKPVERVEDLFTEKTDGGEDRVGPVTGSGGVVELGVVKAVGPKFN
jgi:hypothetical protein